MLALCQVIAKFHYTDTDTDPNGPARTQRRFAAKKVRVRVRVVEFSYASDGIRSDTYVSQASPVVPARHAHLPVS